MREQVDERVCSNLLENRVTCSKAKELLPVLIDECAGVFLDCFVEKGELWMCENLAARRFHGDSADLVSWSFGVGGAWTV